MNSSQTQPPSDTPISIETIEISIENLLKSWNKRQRWKLLFTSTEHDPNPKRSPWRTHLANFLESPPLRVISLSLLLVDLTFAILELSSSLLSSTQNKNRKAEEVWYHWVGIGILSLLCLKSMGLMVGLGFSFFRRPGYVVDGVVLMGALVLEAFLEGKGGGLLAVVSLWRVVRVVESAFELSDEAIEAQIEGIVCEFEGLRDENRRLLETTVEKDKVIEKLKEEVDQCRNAI